MLCKYSLIPGVLHRADNESSWHALRIMQTLATRQWKLTSSHVYLCGLDNSGKVNVAEQQLFPSYVLHAQQWGWQSRYGKALLPVHLLWDFSFASKI